MEGGFIVVALASKQSWWCYIKEKSKANTAISLLWYQMINIYVNLKVSDIKVIAWYSEAGVAQQ